MRIFIASSNETKQFAKWIEDILLTIARDEKVPIETLGWWEHSALPFWKIIL